jgi:hypothetical protein
VFGPSRSGEPLLKSVRQLIESVNDTPKGQLGLEQHGGRTIEGVAIRVLPSAYGPEERKLMSLNVEAGK